MVIVDALNPAERRAVAIVGLLIKMHGGKDGDGLFSGLGRYQVLVERLRLAAERSRDVRQAWDLSHRMMLWSIGPQKYDEAVLQLIEPAPDDAEVLRSLAERTASVVMIARSIARRERAAAAGALLPEPPPFADPLDVFDLVADSAGETP